jgi:fido (protein-threonine AMPylation protein)
MPHRAGYFVLAYQWDHHCHDLVELLKGRFNHIGHEISKLKYQEPWNLEALINYYNSWHYNRQLYDTLFRDIDRRRYIINTFGERGYGVNKDLEKALEELSLNFGESLYGNIKETFYRQSEFVKSAIFMPQELLDSMDSGYIITELCYKLNWQPHENIPQVSSTTELNLDHYFHVMSNETSWPVNTVIFQKLFLNLGSSSMTIMKGSRGYQDFRSPQELKTIANNNFLQMYHETFSTLHKFTGVDINLFKYIHWVLSKEIDPSAGNFRKVDFPDRNGVTFDYGNFDRELENLYQVLWETAQSFDDLNEFIYNLARSYYFFIGIHPFLDSNGRVGKCFLNHMLLKKGIAPINFKDADEVFALPRYGGAVENMHEYFKERIRRAVDNYFYERWKIEEFGFLHRPIYNVSFDSGFHFRQIDDFVQKLEANFQAYIIDDSSLYSWQFQDQSRAVFPNEEQLYNMVIHCGFTHDSGGKWEQVFILKHSFFINERSSDLTGVRVFDVDFIIELTGNKYSYNYFNCCVVSDDGTRTFNNKGLNYRYRIER